MPSFTIYVAYYCVVTNGLTSFFQIDVLQGDTFFDMVEQSDVDIVKSNLDIENNSSSGNYKTLISL